MSYEPDRVARLWAEYLPRIEDAKRRASEESSVVFVDLYEERILDLPAVVLTLERYLLLHQAGVFDGSCPDDVTAVHLFLWIVSPQFVAEPKASKKFYRKHRKLDVLSYSTGIEQYIERMFRGSAASSKDDSAGSGGNSDWVASIIDVIASEYGWKEEAILRIPIPRLMQYTNRIRVRHGAKAVNFSSEADRLQQEFMERANEPEPEVNDG